MSVTTFSETVCALGEGPLWHPMRNQLFWFDILGKRLLTREADGEQTWQFAEHVSAAGWLDIKRLLIASELGLFAFDLETGARLELSRLEAGNAITRSNDGRADPWGGFWIGTMGKAAEPGAGAIYRFYRGEVRRIVNNITVSNAICFAPDGAYACYCDTHDGRILRQPLGAEGWPVGSPEVYLDFSGEDWGPDGAVIDTEGCLWNAQWGGGRVARYAPDGTFLSSHPVPTPHATCPSFGGPDMSTLFVTTAARPGDATRGDAGPGDDRAAGRTYAIEVGVRGQAEPRVIL